MDRSAPGSVPNYLVPAILTTIFCCLPFGVVAIVYAAQVDGRLMAGDYAGAEELSNRAKKWAIASAASSAVLIACALLASLANHSAR